VSPLKALSATSTRTSPTARGDSRDLRRETGLDGPRITAAVRTGDTPASERAAMIRTPPHILVTTPESLYLLLTAERSRERLRPSDRHRRRDPRGHRRATRRAPGADRSSGWRTSRAAGAAHRPAPRRRGPIDEVAAISSAPTTALDPAWRAARSSTTATDGTRTLALEIPRLAARGRDVALRSGRSTTIAWPR
jgi:hypothetical protein